MTLGAGALWGLLVAYGIAMYLVAPATRTIGGFFRGHNRQGQPASTWSLMASLFIIWIMAKSVTNAANLGAAYGIVGGLAYATYWLSIPVAGCLIYRLRTREGATGLVPYLQEKYGPVAALTFTAAIGIRLYNEIWSNTSVVGGYFGRPGETSFLAAAALFTLFVVLYTIKGGLRTSIVTDVIQAVVFVFFLGIVLFFVVPRHDLPTLFSAGTFRLETGVDLVFVALVQTLSYPFHDPILTDRGFITSETAMRKAYLGAGILGFLGILLFSLVGVHAYLNHMPVSGNVPAVVGQAFGLIGLFVMTAIMINSAGSTIDSTLSSTAKLVGIELPTLADRSFSPSRAVTVGIVSMIVIAIIGSVPMVLGTDILKATTISGTMVMGLAPIFLFGRWIGYSPWSFHLSFWTGLLMGVLQVVGAVPQSLAIGQGQYALLLGANVYGLIFCMIGFWVPLAWVRRAEKVPT
jgi:Na+/proline symporter